MSTPADESGRPARSIDPARRERLLLCAALAEAGPGAPTECAGWNTADLAAHLVVREGRLDAAPGILVPPLAFYTERVRRRTARKVPFDRLVDRIRRGPPKSSPFAVPVVDKIANAVEFFVHHEDIRRARPDWESRTLPAGLEELLWRRIKIARFVLKKVPVDVTLVQPDGRSLHVSGARRGASGGAAGPVRVHGPVGELVLWALGRTGVARVRVTGPTDSVKTLTKSGWGF
ncbi:MULTISPECIES: TIGR03085 family metal-binding protein [Thermomonosporaceae]|uniref:TIGR03085 family metal-binding protein n=1 Tax=Thermomonosporaceae TaxID=2012 RepID=UPI00255B3F28|nr:MULTISPECIES: TIGR03085 family metal-binding protein [Thermomonosporaceae]MDL4770965.1 TIGR03085 family metal-binding protein [Actinomadura xylanilytica]